MAYDDGRDEVVSLERGCGPEAVDLSFFSDFVDGRRRVLVQDSMRTSLGRRATATCALLRTAGLFIDSQSLIANGIFLDLAIAEAPRSFWCA
jgi:hypothetical protein